MVGQIVDVSLAAGWSPAMAVPTLLTRLSEALDRAGLSAQAAVARHVHLSQPSSRLMAAVTGLPRMPTAAVEASGKAVAAGAVSTSGVCARRASVSRRTRR